MMNETNIIALTVGVQGPPGVDGIQFSDLSANAPLNYNPSTGAFSLQKASITEDGYLSAADWAAFNSGGGGGVSYKNLQTDFGAVSLPLQNYTGNGVSNSTSSGAYNMTTQQILSMALANTVCLAIALAYCSNNGVSLFVPDGIFWFCNSPLDSYFYYQNSALPQNGQDPLNIPVMKGFTIFGNGCSSVLRAIGTHGIRLTSANNDNVMTIRNVWMQPGMLPYPYTTGFSNYYWTHYAGTNYGFWLENTYSSVAAQGTRGPQGGQIISSSVSGSTVTGTLSYPTDLPIFGKLNNITSVLTNGYLFYQNILVLPFTNAFSQSSGSSAYASYITAYAADVAIAKASIWGASLPLFKTSVTNGVTGPYQFIGYILPAFSSLSVGDTIYYIPDRYKFVYQNTGGVAAFLAPNGTVATNGTITLNTPLPGVYANCWLKLPSGAVAGGVAGLYYCQMTSTTTGTVLKSSSGSNLCFVADNSTGDSTFEPTIPTGTLVGVHGSNVSYTASTIFNAMFLLAGTGVNAPLVSTMVSAGHGSGANTTLFVENINFAVDNDILNESYRRDQAYCYFIELLHVKNVPIGRIKHINGNGLGNPNYMTQQFSSTYAVYVDNQCTVISVDDVVTNQCDTGVYCGSTEFSRIVAIEYNNSTGLVTVKYSSNGHYLNTTVGGSYANAVIAGMGAAWMNTQSTTITVVDAYTLTYQLAAGLADANIMHVSVSAAGVLTITPPNSSTNYTNGVSGAGNVTTINQGGACPWIYLPAGAIAGQPAGWYYNTGGFVYTNYNAKYGVTLPQAPGSNLLTTLAVGDGNTYYVCNDHSNNLSSAFGDPKTDYKIIGDIYIPYNWDLQRVGSQFADWSEALTINNINSSLTNSCVVIDYPVTQPGHQLTNINGASRNDNLVITTGNYCYVDRTISNKFKLTAQGTSGIYLGSCGSSTFTNVKCVSQDDSYVDIGIEFGSHYETVLNYIASTDAVSRAANGAQNNRVNGLDCVLINYFVQFGPIAYGNSIGDFLLGPRKSGQISNNGLQSRVIADYTTVGSNNYNPSGGLVQACTLTLSETTQSIPSGTATAVAWDGSTDGTSGTYISKFTDFISIKSVKSTASTITFTTTDYHGLVTGQYVKIYGITDSGYTNANYFYPVAIPASSATVTSPTTFTVSNTNFSASNPANGTWPASVVSTICCIAAGYATIPASSTTSATFTTDLLYPLYGSYIDTPYNSNFKLGTVYFDIYDNSSPPKFKGTYYSVTTANGGSSNVFVMSISPSNLTNLITTGYFAIVYQPTALRIPNSTLHQFQIGASIMWDVSSAGAPLNQTEILFILNGNTGSSIADGPVNTLSATKTTVQTLLNNLFNSGQNLYELYVYQNTGAALNILKNGNTNTISGYGKSSSYMTIKQVS